VAAALLVLRGRAQRALRLPTDGALRLTQHEPERTKVIKMRRLPGAPVAALEGGGPLGLQERQVGSGRAALRSAHRGGELGVLRFFGDDQAKTLCLGARIGVLIDL